MSGSLRELSKAISAAFASKNLSALCVDRPELPESISAALTQYFSKHEHGDPNDALRLHDDLALIFNTRVAEADTVAEAMFVQVLQQVTPVLMASKEKTQYWIQQMMILALDSDSRSRVIVEDSRQFLFNVMVFDVYNPYGAVFPAEYYEELSTSVADSLLQIFLGIKKLPGLDAAEDDQDNRERAFQCVQNAERELRRFGSRRPKALFTVLDSYFIQPEHRISVLSLLCSFLQAQPPYLFETHDSQLVEHLYQCLLHDKSAVAMNLASTAFVMLLPHICSIMGSILPKIFSIYARLLYWDVLFRKNYSEESDEGASSKVDEQVNSSGRGNIAYGGVYYNSEPQDNNVGTISLGDTSTSTTDEWRVLEGAVDDPAGAGRDSSAVNYSRLYTFIYGTYPIHFLTFITNPRRYFHMVQATMSKHIDFDIDDISRRSQHLSRRHLLHPNFFRYTFETELTDKNRWEVAGTAEDIAAFCITLDTGNMEMPEIPEPAVIFRGFHDQAERAFNQSFDGGKELQQPVENAAPGEDAAVDTAEVGSFNDLSLDDIPEDSFLFAAGGDTAAVVSGQRASAKSSEHGSVGAGAVPEGISTFKSNPGSVSSMSASGDVSTTASQMQHRRIVDIESILDSHKDINSRAISRHGSEDGSVNFPSPLTRVSSADPPATSISPVASREETSSFLAAQSSALSPKASAASDAPGTPSGTVSNLSLQIRDSPSGYMQLSHSITTGSGGFGGGGIPRVGGEGSENSDEAKFVTAYFQKQLLTLRNELNFERYLKQLRLRNLRRLKEQYSELQRDDASIQGLILSNNSLHVKLQRLQNDAKKQHANLTNIATDRAKYANQLLQKNRDLRAEREIWRSEEETVRGALDASRREVEMLKKDFLDKEAEIERLNRSLAKATAMVGEAVELREKYSELRARLFEKHARGADQGTLSMENEEKSFLKLQVAKLEMRVKASELESENAKKGYAARVEELEAELRRVQSKGK
ncbi:Hamartin protein-domain-containing protein [Myxozyma melibiosi]|uniref:Hamartin protein-domain-containing protein n=1 Tax=Myxozyma melibiosi TaxID=54550 RepID=A0ABR1EY87_9ASCO